MRKYRPQQSLVEALLASPTRPMPPAQRVHHLGAIYGGLRELEQAKAPTPDDWRRVADGINMMETLVERGVAEDSSGLLRDAIVAMAEASLRPVVRLDGPGITAVRAVLEDYAALVDILPHRMMIECLRATDRRIREMQAGRLRSSDIIVASI